MTTCISSIEETTTTTSNSPAWVEEGPHVMEEDQSDTLACIAANATIRTRASSSSSAIPATTTTRSRNRVSLHLSAPPATDEEPPPVVAVPAAAWHVMSWLLSTGRAMRRMSDLVEGCAAQLQQHGVPVDRFFVGATLIHAQCSAYDWKWEQCTRAVTEVSIPKKFYDRRYELFGADAPLIYLETHDCCRIRATDSHIPDNCRDLFQRGYVDLYGRKLTLQDGEYGGGITWATQHIHGFSTAHVALLDAILPALSTVIQFFIKDLCMVSLLRTYLGNDPGERVHRGCEDALLGPPATVRSVVWFSDVRGFTQLSYKLPRDDLIALLNEIFHLSERVLSQRGGEVLKFMGDGVMGVFTADPSEQQSTTTPSHKRKNGATGVRNICAVAREAAVDFQTQMAALRQDWARRGFAGADTHVGVGLHYGDVSYGNVGTPTRLDFTVIGPAVNVASRVEGKCSVLEAHVLASRDFVDNDENAAAAWNSRGEHAMKGLEKPLELFELVLNV